MKHCPNCGLAVEDGQQFCGNCGAETPPLPILEAGGERVSGKLLTRAARLDVALGVGAVFGSLLLAGIGVLVPLVLYFVLRRTHVAFARGLGYGLLAVAAIFLGLLAICLASLNKL